MKDGLLELKWSSKAREKFMACEIAQPKISPAKSPLRCEIISQRSGDFAGETFGCEISQAMNFSLAFELHFSSKRPSFIFFAIPPTIDN